MKPLYQPNRNIIVPRRWGRREDGFISIPKIGAIAGSARRRPITATSLTTGTNASGVSSCDTASVSPGVNRLLLLSVTSWELLSTEPNAATATGCGLTWVSVQTVYYDNSSASRRKLTLLRAMGTPTSGAITLDFAAQNQGEICWQLVEFDNVKTSGTNGSGAVVQNATALNTAGATTLTATLAAFASAQNATFGTWGLSSDYTRTPGTGFATVGTPAGTANCGGWCEFRNDNDTTVDGSVSTSAQIGLIGVEIAHG